MELVLAILLVVILLATLKRWPKKPMKQDSEEYLSEYYKNKKPRQFP